MTVGRCQGLGAVPVSGAGTRTEDLLRADAGSSSLLISPFLFCLFKPGYFTGGFLLSRVSSISGSGLSLLSIMKVSFLK